MLLSGRFRIWPVFADDSDNDWAAGRANTLTRTNRRMPANSYSQAFFPITQEMLLLGTSVSVTGESDLSKHLRAVTGRRGCIIISPRRLERAATVISR
jgi:hypothetical protein